LEESRREHKNIIPKRNEERKRRVCREATIREESSREEKER
jgi:hypothetical protein